MTTTKKPCVTRRARGPGAAACSKRLVSILGHRAMLLVRRSGKQKSEFVGSSQSSGSPVSPAASGFLLMTKSRQSPASIIRGTVRQQSKSLVLTRFTCKIKINKIAQSTCYYIYIYLTGIV